LELAGGHAVANLSMHALVPPILLRLTRLDAFMANA
jgi:hypothetical protein